MQVDFVLCAPCQQLAMLTLTLILSSTPPRNAPSRPAVSAVWPGSPASVPCAKKATLLQMAVAAAARCVGIVWVPRWLPTTLLQCSMPAGRLHWTLVMRTSMCTCLKPAAQSLPCVQCGTDCAQCSDAQTCSKCNTMSLVGGKCVRCEDPRCRDCSGNVAVCRKCVQARYIPDPSTKRCRLKVPSQKQVPMPMPGGSVRSR